MSEAWGLTRPMGALLCAPPIPRTSLAHPDMENWGAS